MDFHRHADDERTAVSSTGGQELYEDGMLAHVAPEHRYAERIVDVTPDWRTAMYSQRLIKDGTGVWGGVNPVLVRIGEVEAGTFWLVENIVLETGLATDVGFAKIKQASALAVTRAFIVIGANGVQKDFEPPLFLGRGEVFVLCTQTTPAASSVNITAQVREVVID